MLPVFSAFLTRFSLLLFLFTMASCHSDTEEVLTTYNNHKFDLHVIEKLPIYDSLASAIREKIGLIQKYINENDAYQAFRYMPTSYEATVFKKLPPEVGADIDRHFNNLGKKFIYGFDVFKDSSIKIYIRNLPSETTPVDIEENLSYYPSGSKMKQRRFPVKDTILNKYWQYWILFNKQSLF